MINSNEVGVFFKKNELKKHPRLLISTLLENSSHSNLTNKIFNFLEGNLVDLRRFRNKLFKYINLTFKHVFQVVQIIN